MLLRRGAVSVCRRGFRTSLPRFNAAAPEGSFQAKAAAAAAAKDAGLDNEISAPRPRVPPARVPPKLALSEIFQRAKERQMAPEEPYYCPPEMTTINGLRLFDSTLLDLEEVFEEAPPDFTQSNQFAEDRVIESVDHTDLKMVDNLQKVTGTNERTNMNLFHVFGIGRHTNVTRGGRVFSFSALVLLGNGEGTAGFGYGRGTTVPEAIEDATDRAQRSLVSIVRWKDNSLGEASAATFKKAGVRLRVLAPGSGYRAGPVLQQIFRSFGLDNVAGEWVGPSRSRRKRFAAAFKAIEGARNPDLIARSLGLKHFDLNKIHRRGNRIWSY